MGGGSSCIANLTKVSGLGLPSIEYEEKQYAGQSGITTTGRRDLPRTITLSGDLNGGQREIMKMLRSFYYAGELYCQSGSICRKIACKCTNLDDIEKHHNCGINGFTVQFQADSPYFCDYYDTTLALSGYKNHVTESFTLPCVFTEKLQQGDCDNTGDIICYPIINISAKHAPAANEATITLSNNTTGAQIVLHHTMECDETVTIDLPARQIVSNIKGDITHKTADNINLSDFYLEVGNNALAFATTDKSQPLAAMVTYNNKYIMGAV